MTPVALRNGEPVTQIAVTDRGLHYGDGVFRTVRVAGGRPVAWSTHLQRLRADCGQLALPVPDAATLRWEAEHLFADGADGTLKIMITRGSGGRGYTPPAVPEASRLLLRYPAAARPPHAARGIDAGYCDTPLAVSPALAGAKHLNRLEHVLARAECEARGWPEGLMRTVDGRVVCGTMSNLFLVVADELITPAITDAGVRGATRARILAACEDAGRPCRETAVVEADLARAQEIFVSNSMMEIWPVRSLGGRDYPAGGPWTRWCRQGLEASA